jgi:hypothetical protein
LSHGSSPREETEDAFGSLQAGGFSIPAAGSEIESVLRGLFASSKRGCFAESNRGKPVLAVDFARAPERQAFAARIGGTGAPRRCGWWKCFGKRSCGEVLDLRNLMVAQRHFAWRRAGARSVFALVFNSGFAGVC